MRKLSIFILCLSFNFGFSQNFNEAINAYDEGRYDEAFIIFSQLAERGHVDALNNLGTLYQTGKGTTINYVFAVENYREAAAMGHINAAYNLSNLTRLGIGIDKDNSESYAWSILAARDGASDMIAYRDTLEKQLNSNQITQAYSIAKTLLEVIEEQEMAAAWLLPSGLKNPLPKHIQELSPPKKLAKTEDKNHRLKDDINIPIGFSALSPNDSQDDKKTSFDNSSIKNHAPSRNTIDSQVSGIQIPKGFSTLTPKQKENFQTPSLPNQNSNISGIEIPAGFSALTPKKNDDNIRILNENVTPKPATKIDGVFIPTGFTALTPFQEESKSKEIIEEIPTPNVNLEKHKTYPTQLGNSGQTLFRPQAEGRTEYKGATVLKPRRVIPAKETQLGESIDNMDPTLRQIIQSIANTHQLSFNQTFNAILKMNPKSFKKDENNMIILEDPNEQLRIPSKNEIIKKD